MSDRSLPQAEEVDVLLLLEGTFPYVAGGVSSWVNQIIRGFPELRFGAIFLGARPEDYGDMRYQLPTNLVHLQVSYLYDQRESPPVMPAQAEPQIMRDVERLHALLHDDIGHPDCPQLFARLMDEAGPDGRLTQEVFLYSRAAWEYVKKGYRQRSSDPSFVDYFWTIRTIHTPFWRLRDVALSAPRARVYHSISTGYAGILGLLLKHRHRRPFMLSEHGIYVKERKIDLYQAQWLKDNRSVFEHDPSRLSYFRQLWIRFFEHLGYLTYQAADDIVALYEANRQRQLADGAPEERTCNVPNGIDVPRFAALREQRAPTPPPVLCLIGRVVPIKDIKTYIRAMRGVVNRMPEAEGWIAGPEDESPEYARECRDLVAQLGLEGKVKFLGFQKLTDLLPQVGLVVLSSISEALPLVILEGYAAGVPTVSTDVGSCRQLVYGLPGEDEAIGASGRVVRIADPEALSQAAVELLSDPSEWQRASAAAIRRVEAYYSQDMMFGRYRELYEKNFGKSAAWQA
ncbi:MAG TPA: glycosyl transferase family 1 [Curvibacter sp.]|nr:glycosyl transferase family 1 [Curvibacter sp.]